MTTQLAPYAPTKHTLGRTPMIVTAVSNLGQCVNCGHAHVVDCGIPVAALDNGRVVYIRRDERVPDRMCRCGCSTEARLFVEPGGPSKVGGL